MDAYIFDVLQLILRYFHVVAGIAWIGASFYFIWLDNNLTTPPQWKQDQGIKGDLWAIHGGGFYEVAKYQNAPKTMPETLHWFKWEAYTTWISGFLLFSLLYYVGANTYLIDNSKMDLMPWQAISISLGLLLLGLGFYELIAHSPLANKGVVFCLVCIAALTLYFYGLNQLFSQKAAMIQTGALIGTCMAANVFLHIMPAQRYLVNEVTHNRQPDAAPGLKAKNRSVHNNYATLPILFIMLSSHFSVILGREPSWAILAAVISIGMWMRHYFNLKHQGKNRPWVLISALLAFLSLIIALAPWPKATETATIKPAISHQQGMAIIEKHCQSCHSQAPTSPLFSQAPVGLILNNLEQVKQHKEAIISRTVISKDMPLGNMSNMTDKERGTLNLWLNP